MEANYFIILYWFCHTSTWIRQGYTCVPHFELWCWRRLLRVHWSARRSNQSILKEINTGCSLERLMLKLKLQYFGHLMGRADSLEKTLMLGKTKNKRKMGWERWDGWMASLTQWTWAWASSGRWWRTGKPAVLQSVCCAVLSRSVMSDSLRPHGL